MANLTESNNYDAGVYQIETTDAVIGGATGIANKAAINLANRTKYLKDRVDKLESGTLGPGGDVKLTAVQTLTNKTLESAKLTNGYTEGVFSVTGTTPALSPANGSVQLWALTGNSTPTAGAWAAGQSITLMVDDGSAYAITWTSLGVTWLTKSGAAPTLNTSGYTAIVLWKINGTSVIYGASVGGA